MALWQWNPTSFQGKDLSEKVSPESTASLTEKVTTAPIIVQSVTFIKKGLKKSKAPAEVIEIAPGKIVEPEKNVTATWPPDVRTLIDSFLALEQPTKPFYLEDHRHIVNPVKFFESLRRGIEAGPAGPRARMGTLQCDLRKLNAYLN